MIVKKTEKKTKRPDYGSTITPKQSAEMLTFLVDEVCIVSTKGLRVCPRNTELKCHSLFLRPKLFVNDETGRVLSRYELSDVCCLRDCLSLLLGRRDGPANVHGTRVYTVTENDPMARYMDILLQCVDPRDKSYEASEVRRVKCELDEVLHDVLEFYRCHLEARRNAVVIVPNDDRGW